jgi:hypothetical protein
MVQYYDVLNNLSLRDGRIVLVINIYDTLYESYKTVGDDGFMLGEARSVRIMTLW